MTFILQVLVILSLNSFTKILLFIQLFLYTNDRLIYGGFVIEFTFVIQESGYLLYLWFNYISLER